MQLHKKPRGTSGKKILLFFLLLLLGGGIYAGMIYFEKELPKVNFTETPEYIGTSSALTIIAKDAKSGLRSLIVSISQNGKEHLIVDKRFERLGFSGQMGAANHSETIEVNVKSLKLKDGEAEISIIVRDYSLLNFFKGNETTINHTVTVDTSPPVIRIVHAEKYIEPGGSGIVIYQMKGEASRHGADFSSEFFKGYPLGDGRDDFYIAYIALPYDSNGIESSFIVAEDYAGNEGVKPFSSIFKNKRKKSDRINISDNFLNAKIPEFEMYYPEMKGDFLRKYLYANNAIRIKNNEKIRTICQSSEDIRMWEGKFGRMAGASKAGFADYRTYFYKGKQIDKQVHLGMDIASTRRAEVKAANKGKVVYADYLGIYGNMVILDHGQGVFSLYSHLSRIQVAVGDIVGSNIVLGLTGKSGMAGGDHLHFSMLVNGVFVTPKEWWDPNWIEVTIDEPIADSRF